MRACQGTTGIGGVFRFDSFFLETTAKFFCNSFVMSRLGHERDLFIPAAYLYHSIFGLRRVINWRQESAMLSSKHLILHMCVEYHKSEQSSSEKRTLLGFSLVFLSVRWSSTLSTL